MARATVALALAAAIAVCLVGLCGGQPCNHPLVSWDYAEDPVGTWFGEDSHWDPRTPEGYNEVEILGSSIVTLSQDVADGPAKMHTIKIGADAQWQISPQSQGQVLAGSAQEECAPLCPSIPGWVVEEAPNRVQLPPLLVFDGSTDPVFSAPHSGFGEADTLSIFVDFPKKYFSVSLSFGLPSTAETASIWGDSPDHLYGCYDRWNLTASFADVEPLLTRSTNAQGIIRYTGIVHYHAEETIWTRVPHNRTIDQDVVFELIFPQQVTAVFNGISAFDIPNTGAGVLFQEVNVQVQNPPAVDFEVRIATSLQHPFRFSATGSTFDFPASVFSAIDFTLDDDCADLGVTDSPNPTVDNALQCFQVWKFNGTVAPGVCEADGSYSFTVQYDCHDSFKAQTDCPLVKDDQDAIVSENTLQFAIDTEYFCPIVVDQIAVAALLDAWRNLAHNSAASNFQAGQTIFFRVFVTAPQVSIVGLTIADIFLTVTESNSTYSQTTNYDVYLGGVDQAVVNNLQVYNAGESFTLNAGQPNEATHTVPLGLASAAVSDECEGPAGTGDPCAEGWFEWTLDEPVFDPPEDGSRSFNVIAKLLVDWASVPNQPLLEARREVVFKRVLLESGRFSSRAAVSDIVVEAADFVPQTTGESSEDIESAAFGLIPSAALLLSYAACIRMLV